MTTAPKLEPRYTVICECIDALRKDAEGAHPDRQSVVEECIETLRSLKGRAAPSAGPREALEKDLASVKPALKAEQRKLAKARRRIHQLERAIAWALGESPPGIPEFMPPEGGRPPYWWRTQLRALTLSKERGS